MEVVHKAVTPEELFPRSVVCGKGACRFFWVSSAQSPYEMGMGPFNVSQGHAKEAERPLNFWHGCPFSMTFVLKERGLVHEGAAVPLLYSVWCLFVLSFTRLSQGIRLSVTQICRQCCCGMLCSL